MATWEFGLCHRALSAAQLTAWHLRGRVGIERMRFAQHMRAAGWLMLSGQLVHDAGTASAQQERCDRTPSARGSPCLPHAQMTGMGACAMRAQLRRQCGSGFRAAGGRHERCGVPLERSGAHRTRRVHYRLAPSEWSLAVQAMRSLPSSVPRLVRGLARGAKICCCAVGPCRCCFSVCALRVGWG